MDETPAGSPPLTKLLKEDPELKYDSRWIRGESAGEGGQSHAFVVTDKLDQFKGEYVLKRLKTTRPQAQSRFETEIAALKRLNNPGIVKVVDSGITARDSKPFYVMPYLKGGDLRAFKKRHANDIVRLLDCFASICDAVAAAHAAGIIHRDLKPENILIDSNDAPVVCDFGICFDLLDDEGQRFTETEERVGPAGYMAPELERGQLSADKINPTVDIYSLGKIVWYLFATQEKPVPREDWNQHPFNLLGQQHGGDMLYVNERLLARSIVLDPSQRFQAAAEMREATNQIRRLVADGFEPMRPSGMRCKFCGAGHYNTEVDFSGQQGASIPPDGAQKQFYLPQHGRWRIMVCTDCGHCEFFRFDLRHSPGSKVW